MKKKSFARKDPEKKKPRKDVRKAEAKLRGVGKRGVDQSEKIFFGNQEK